MDISKIPYGKSTSDVNVIIEIPRGGEPVKYEIDKDSGALFVDRFMQVAMAYPEHYGFIPHTLSEDGDPVDVMVITRANVAPGCVIRCRPIGALLMEDESGKDEKLIAVPVEKLDVAMKDVKDINDLPEIQRQRITHFFERYKDLEPNKWVKVTGWVGAAEAVKLVEAGLKNAEKKAA